MESFPGSQRSPCQRWCIPGDSCSCLPSLKAAQCLSRHREPCFMMQSFHVEMMLGTQRGPDEPGASTWVVTPPTLPELNVKVWRGHRSEGWFGSKLCSKSRSSHWPRTHVAEDQSDLPIPLPPLQPPSAGILTTLPSCWPQQIFFFWPYFVLQTKAVFDILRFHWILRKPSSHKYPLTDPSNETLSS